MEGFLYRQLDRLPEPLGMVVAWIIYLAVVGFGFAVVVWVVRVMESN